MKIASLIAIIILSLIAAANLFAQTTGNQKKTATEEMNKICPVMGGKTDKKISYQYKDKKYYFCCPECIEVFRKDPEKYIKKLNKKTGEENIKQHLSGDKQHHKGHHH
jgi:YHS domain-containing protein